MHIDRFHLTYRYLFHHWNSRRYGVSVSSCVSDWSVSANIDLLIGLLYQAGAGNMQVRPYFTKPTTSQQAT